MPYLKGDVSDIDFALGGVASKIYDFLSNPAVLDMFLQSLRLFTKDETNRDIFNIRITVEATQPRDPPWKHTVHLNRSNFAELHQFDVILLILKKKTLEICEYMM